jgi:hypothetical protein
MDKKLIQTFVGTLATIAAIPLVYFGLRGMTSGPGVQRAEAFPPTGAGSTQPSERELGAENLRETSEIQLVAGTGADINRALRRLPKGGGRVILGPAIFELREPIVMDRDNVELRGSGKTTVVRLADKANCPVLIVGRINTPIDRIVSGVSLRNLTLDGNRSEQSQKVEDECWGGICDNGGVSVIRNNCLTIRGSHKVTVENIVTRGARSGGVVLEKHCREVRLENLESCENYYDGLACYETEDSSFHRLNLHSNLSAGISLDLDFNNNVFTKVQLLGNGSQGIFMRDSNGNHFKDLEITKNGAQGVFIAQADDDPTTKCTNNVFSDMVNMHNQSDGVRINDRSCTENMVRNSRFQGNKKNVSQAEERLISLMNVTEL